MKLITHDFTKCPRCGLATQDAISWNDTPSEFWKECSNPKCNTFINTYIPQSHQEAFHEDKHLLTGNFGGYGSGKTLTSREELYKHIFLTPGGISLVGANVSSQYEQTIKRDIEYDIPKAFIAHCSTLKSYYDFINGHRLLFRPFDDVNKLRSYNLTSFVIVEASECKAEVFTQLKTRLRNTAAGKQKIDKLGNKVFKNIQGIPVPVMAVDWRRGIIESNPDSGWIRTDVVLKSSKIKKFGDVRDMFVVDEEDKDPFIASYITTSEVNGFLPEDFIQQNAQGKTDWWIQKYLYGSFQYAAGLVYPSALKYVTDDFEIPRSWKRVIAYDYGLSDDSVYLLAAIDEKERNRTHIRRDRNQQ